MPTILIVDDDAAVRDALSEAVADLGHTPVAAAHGGAALEFLEGHRANAVLLDLRMPGIDGLEVLARIRARSQAPPVAILTAVPTSANTIEAMRLGAVDHIAKPIGRVELEALLDRMLAPAPAAAEPASVPAVENELIGHSLGMRQVQKTIGLLADSDATVLITGETGTGKEVVARAIHRHGRRGSGPFVPVNCAAIPAELLESLLFGHVRGAFTGALSDRAGSFREANKGTLFLDEIGDMERALQAKLLRVLQEREVTPVGGRPIRVDARVIVATHRDLAALVCTGQFREDLFYRLGVVPVHLPPLRERLADIVPLAEHFLVLASRGEAKRLSADAAALLLAHAWPGNIRELRNAMERAAALVWQPVINAADLGFLKDSTHRGQAPDWLDGTLPEAVARLEQAMIARALRQTRGNRAQAAEQLGIRRQLLYDKIARYGLETSENRTDPVPDRDEITSPI
jgi:DNA-binding NtrC family response regulator